MNIGVLGAKGGVGSSILSLSLSKFLEKENKIMIADGDWGKRSLDIFLNQEPLVYDFYNLIKGNKKGMTKISENLYYTPASLSKSFYEIEKSECKNLFQSFQKEFSHSIIDFSTKSGRELEVFLPFLDKILLIASENKVSLKNGEGLFLYLKQKRVDVEIIVNGVNDSSTLDHWIKKYLPRWEEYHIIRYCDLKFKENGSIQDLPLDEVKRVWQEIKDGQWENPRIDPPTFWERLRRK